MTPVILLEVADEILDPIADEVANILGGHRNRTAALGILLNKVWARLELNDQAARDFLACRERRTNG